MNNGCFIYEDTFLSLLTLIDYLLKNNIKPANIKNNSYFPNLLDQVIHLELKENKNIFKELISVIGPLASRAVYYVFLSTEENKELIIYYVILNGYKYKEQILTHRNLRCISKTIKISKYVAHEIHK